MDWRSVPSLSSLRAFEAMARTGTFSAAARELNVTHAAIAQHVRGLEDFFSTELAYRDGRGMALTDAGKRLASALHDGFATIASGVRDLSSDLHARPLRVSVTPSFAENWLMPRLGRFWAAYPGTELELKPTERLVDLRHDDIDLAIRYGDGTWPGLRARPLTAGRTIVVGAAGLIGDQRPRSNDELNKYGWLLDRLQPEARVWARNRGVDFDAASVTFFDTNSLVLSAVRAGLGLAIQSRALVEDDLTSGRLVALTEPKEDDSGYYIVTLPGRETAAMADFVRWLLQEAG